MLVESSVKTASCARLRGKYLCMFFLRMRYLPPCVQPKTPPLRGGWTRRPLAKCCLHNRREISETTLTSFTSPPLTHFISNFFTSVAPVLGATESSVSFFFHPKKESPFRLSVSLLLHFFSLHRI